MGLSLTVNNNLREEAFYSLSPSSFSQPKFPFPTQQPSDNTLSHRKQPPNNLENIVLIPKRDIVILIIPDSSWEDIFLRSALYWACKRGPEPPPAGYTTTDGRDPEEL